MKKFASFVVLALVAGLFASQAEARPQYGAGLKKAYSESKNEKLHADKNCAVCHNAKTKKVAMANDFAKALAEALGAKDVKDAEKIAEAIKKVGEKKEGEKTYDEILKAGDLPKAAE